MALHVVSIPAISSKQHAAADVGMAQPLAEQLHAEQVGDQVVGRLGDVLGDALVEVGVESLAGGDPLVGRHVHGFEYVVDERAEQVVVLERQPEHAGDDVDRDVLGVAQRGIEHVGVLVNDGGDEVGAEAAHLRLPAFDRLRGERRQENSSGMLVEGRIAGDRRRSPDRCLREVVHRAAADDDAHGS